jgi:hypothetical protein
VGAVGREAASLVPERILKVDYLRGLKENVIIGRLIPAGTGMEYYRRVKIPGEIIERPTTGLEGATYEAEYLVEPEHIKEGAEV